EPPFGMLISPLILTGLVIIIFIFPNTLADSLLKPAIMSIYPFIEMNEIGTISYWHGWNTELFMTLGIIIVGTLLFFWRHQIKKIFVLLPYELSLDRLYNRTLHYGDRLAHKITDLYMTEYLRDYFTYLFVFVIVLLGGTFAYANIPFLSTAQDESIQTFEWILALTTIIAGIAIPVVTSRLN